MPLVKTYEPLNILKPVAKNIWIVDGPIIYMQQFGLNIPFSTRMTIIRLPDPDGGDKLFIHSPVKPDQTLLQSLDKLGSVAHLISPNKLHYAFIGQWAKRYPNAVSWASPGVRERAKKHNIDVKFDRDLTEEPDEAWAACIGQTIFGGGRFMDEVVFFHKASKTLILADLIENFETSRTSVFMRILARLGGVLDPDGKMPLDLRQTFRGRHHKACKAYKQMLDWRPEKIILSHGRWYEKDGVRELKRAFRWLKCGY